MLRRITALLMILATVGSTLEVGLGLAREGDVHHESTARAVTHANSHAGPIVGHGHEDVADQRAAPDDEPSEHEHGTCVDHCTHLHGAAVPGLIAFFFQFRVVEAHLPPEPERSRELIAPDLFQPPKA